VDAVYHRKQHLKHSYTLRKLQEPHAALLLLLQQQQRIPRRITFSYHAYHVSEIRTTYCTY
jgi:hypothetical protein